jgi:hypothetical protein
MYFSDKSYGLNVWSEFPGIVRCGAVRIFCCISSQAFSKISKNLKNHGFEILSDCMNPGGCPACRYERDALHTWRASGRWKD